jgi:hypothetical protein
LLTPLQEQYSRPPTGEVDGVDVNVNESVAAAIREIDVEAQRALYEEQGSVLMIEDFLPQDVLNHLLEGLQSVDGQAHRNYVPRQKKGAAISRFCLESRAGQFREFYQAPSLRKLLNSLTGETLLDCREADPHTYALYLYDEPGDHIDWHYDTSFYRGKRFTILIGLVENESCLLECKLHTRSEGREPESRAYQIKPGSMFLFDGDKLFHRVTPMAEGDSSRVVLTLEFVTDTSMNAWRKLVSDVKDAFAYFGLREVFLGPKADSPSRDARA